jgi:aryl-alcohol dehydrogenase-like predicted oxidoreductase
MFGTAQPWTRRRSLDAYFAAGGNFIDTAHSYGDWIPGIPNAASERTLGALLKERPRDDYVIATKGCEFDYRKGDFALRVTPAFLDADLSGSLELLGLDCIDLYWLHRDDPARPVQEIVDALIGHQRAGRIRHFGCSNWSVARIREARQYAASLGHSGFVACQPMGRPSPTEPMMTYAHRRYYEDGYGNCTRPHDDDPYSARTAASSANWRRAPEEIWPRCAALY